MIHSPWATRLTVFGVRDMDNHKPFRDKQQKAVACLTAKVDEDGLIRSHAPRSLHNATTFKPTKQQRKHAAAYYRRCGEEARAVAVMQETT